MSKPVTTNPALQRLIGRAILEPTFRAELLRDPAATLRAADLELDDDDLAHLARQIDERGADVPRESADLRSFW
jgi:hypothetical protein